MPESSPRIIYVDGHAVGGYRPSPAMPPITPRERHIVELIGITSCWLAPLIFITMFIYSILPLN